LQPPDEVGRAVIVAAVLLLVLATTLANRVLPGWACPLCGLVTAAGLVGLARWSGLRADAIGLDHAHLRRAGLFGLVGLGVVALGFGIALAVPALRSFFHDGRMPDLAISSVLWVALIRIPLGHRAAGGDRIPRRAARAARRWRPLALGAGARSVGALRAVARASLTRVDAQRRGVLGRRIVEILPYVPIAIRIRTGIAVLSYADRLAIGITADRDSTLDVDVLSSALSKAIAELVTASRRGAASTRRG